MSHTVVKCHAQGCCNDVEEYRWKELSSMVCAACANSGLADTHTITGKKIQPIRTLEQLELLRPKVHVAQVDVIQDS